MKFFALLDLRINKTNKILNFFFRIAFDHDQNQSKNSQFAT